MNINVLGNCKRLNQLTTQFPLSILFLVLLTFILHFLYQWWENALFFPFINVMEHLTAWSIKILIDQSQALMILIDTNFYIEGNTFFIEATDNSVGWLRIDPACTSLKSWFYWSFIIILIAGPWKHKIWYYTLGLFIIQLANAIRILLLAIVLTHLPNKFEFYHDFLNSIFYAVIFLLWLIWIEKFSPKTRHYISI